MVVSVLIDMKVQNKYLLNLDSILIIIKPIVQPTITYNQTRTSVELYQVV